MFSEKGLSYPPHYTDLPVSNGRQQIVKTTLAPLIFITAKKLPASIKSPLFNLHLLPIYILHSPLFSPRNLSYILFSTSHPYISFFHSTLLIYAISHIIPHSTKPTNNKTTLQPIPYPKAIPFLFNLSLYPIHIPRPPFTFIIVNQEGPAAQRHLYACCLLYIIFGMTH